MQHSTWDLEVHAREMQRRRLQEADRARQIEMARQHGEQMRGSATRLSISHLINAFRDRLSPRHGSLDSAVPARAAAALLPLPREEQRLSPDARSGGLSQPYAGMVVLARGTSAQSAVQPCTADC